MSVFLFFTPRKRVAVKVNINATGGKKDKMVQIGVFASGNMTFCNAVKHKLF